MSKPGKHFYEFGPFRIDARTRFPIRDGKPVPVTPKACELLLALIQNSGRVLGKEELMQTLWPDTIVEENNLTVTLSALRKALGESAGQKYIETIPKRGYRFVATVKELWDEGTDVILSS
ncbi:MAG: transcriptional regulator [Acidobacteria bacterium]|nr:transcriptional regulator [Acidobacteriota bacterium]